MKREGIKKSDGRKRKRKVEEEKEKRTKTKRRCDKDETKTKPDSRHFLRFAHSPIHLIFYSALSYSSYSS